MAACVARTAEGEVWTGKLEWLGETRRAIKDAVMAAASNGPETATSEAADWLVDYLNPPERERGVGPGSKPRDTSDDVWTRHTGSKP